MTDIITLTPNPAIDLWCEAETVRPIHKIRTYNEAYDPGGGGINVARVVATLGGDAEAIALAGGVTGALLGELLAEAGLRYRLIPIAGRTRISHTVHETKSGLEYRFVPSGPQLSEAEIESCLKVVGEVDCRYFVASGSLPEGMPQDFFVRVAKTVTAKGARFVLDSSGVGLTATLGAAPVYLIKPSLSEIEHLAGRKLPDPAAQDAAAREVARSGLAEVVAVTLGHEGALVATADTVVRMPTPKVVARSTVGAGDSFLGAMTLALSRGRSLPEALASGIAGGAAAVLRPGTKLCDRADVDRLYREVTGG
jgi:6-phosphofructokinase 2